MSDTRTYRHRATGVIREYPESLARVFKDLELVDADAPCITCQPAPAEVELLADHSDESAEDIHGEPAGSADDKEE
ncbi:MAG: hypothetical protein ACTH32_06315 [Microbacterium gubbeenense]|uniref:hypothetical protein n=1 Tax=Microbacterium gubbeenense TaxID=159896 RepID=UPI003F99F836